MNKPDENEARPVFHQIGQLLDINECETEPCGKNAICVNELGSYRCECENGFRRSKST